MDTYQSKQCRPKFSSVLIFCWSNFSSPAEIFGPIINLVLFEFSCRVETRIRKIKPFSVVLLKSTAVQKWCSNVLIQFILFTYNKATKNKKSNNNNNNNKNKQKNKKEDLISFYYPFVVFFYRINSK